MHNSTLVLASTSLFGLLTLPLIAKRRRSILLFPACVLLASAVFLFSGCGGGGSSGGGGATTGTPAGTYSLTVTASTGSVKDSQTLTLIVQ
jgi:hypothetical protein